jgi:hypothetical protein
MCCSNCDNGWKKRVENKNWSRLPLASAQLKLVGSVHNDGIETKLKAELPVVAVPQGGMHEINIERAAKANDAEVPVFLWDIWLSGTLGWHDEFSEKELVGINYSCR